MKQQQEVNPVLLANDLALQASDAIFKLRELITQLTMEVSRLQGNGPQSKKEGLEEYNAQAPMP